MMCASDVIQLSTATGFTYHRTARGRHFVSGVFRTIVDALLIRLWNAGCLFG